MTFFSMHDSGSAGSGSKLSVVCDASGFFTDSARLQKNYGRDRVIAFESLQTKDMKRSSQFKKIIHLRCSIHN